MVVRRHPLLIATGVLAVAPLLAAAYVMTMIPLTPSIKDIQRLRAEAPTTIMSADGQTLATFRRTNREWVKLSDVSPKVVEALVATEDHRFYEHHGLDLWRTVGAAFHTARGNLQGGSTLSQQLARNLFPQEIGRAPTIERKVKEAITAFKLESLYSKNDILEMYLNTVPFLYNAYGIEMAARTYFDKNAGELDVLEAATLIGMLKGTSYYNPVLNPERAVQRRNTVLAQLVKHGKLPGEQFDGLKDKPLGLAFEKQDDDLGPAPHLAQQLRRWLITWADSHGYNINADGLVVRTTINSKLQEMAIDALRRHADKLQVIADRAWGKGTSNKQLLAALLRETPQYRAEIDSGYNDADALKKLQADTEFLKAFWRDKSRLQAAFLAQDPVNGHVKAWVGSRDFKLDQFDHVQQARRQPGSTFKPFVYGAAFAQGISPAEMFLDQPTEIRLDDKTVWKPTDVHESTGEPTTLRDGLIHSKNTITAQLIQRVGPARVAQLAQAMGVRQSKLDVVPSLALGTSPVTLKEMVSGYSTIANSGTFLEPVLVLRIENAKGEVLEEFHPRAPQEALPLAASQTLLDVMRGVVDEGTGAAIRSSFGLRGDLAGKTGTTQDNTDGWFILMHPRLVAGSWVGFNDSRLTMGDSWGQGARNALLIVGDFFSQSVKARAIDPQAKFAAPRNQGVLDAETRARMKESFNNQFRGARDTQAGVQPVGVVEPAVVATPQFEAVPRQSEFSWKSQRQRSEDRRDSVELGAGPARPSLEPRPPGQDSDGGIKILRSF